MSWGERKTEHSELVDRYGRYRKIVWRMNNTILPKYLSRSILDMAGRALGMLHKNELVLGNEDEIGLVIDYAIHECFERGRNAVQRFLADSDLDPDCDEYVVARAMSESFYTLVRVEEVLRGVGVRAVDLLAGREYLLVDMGFGMSAVKGAVVATRLFPFVGFATTSGAPLPVDAEALGRIERSVLTRYRIEEQGKCTLAGGRRKAADCAAAIIRCCLRAGASDRIRYMDLPH